MYIRCPRCDGYTAVELATLIHDLEDWLVEAKQHLEEMADLPDLPFLDDDEDPKPPLVPPLVKPKIMA